jgi:hypothetical protein
MSEKDKIESSVPPSEKRLIELINGDTPKNESEKKIVEEIQEIKKNGGTIDIPFD